MWKYVWFLSAAPYGLLLFIIQTVAAAAECENEVFFFFEVKMGELLDATCSFHSTTSYSPDTYIWLLPIHPLHPLLIPLKFIFLSLPSNPALPPQTVPPKGLFCLGNMVMYYPRRVTNEGLSLNFLDWWQLPEKNRSEFLPWLCAWLSTCWTTW